MQLATYRLHKGENFGGGGRPVRANQNALIFLSSRRIGLIWIFRDGRVRRARGRGKARHFVAGGVAAKYVAEDTLAPPHEQERSSRDPFHAPYGVERDRVTDIGGKVLQLLYTPFAAATLLFCRGGREAPKVAQ